MQSLELKEKLTTSDKGCYLLSETAVSRINLRKETLAKSLEQKSQRSVSTGNSRASDSKTNRSSKASSRLSAALALSRAKAEAAKAKLEFAELEAGLKKKQAQLTEEENLTKVNATRKKAELDADLELLFQKKEAAAAAAEAQVLETYEEDPHDTCSLFETALNLSEADPVSRTQEYVRQQTEFNKGMKQASFNPEQVFKIEGDTIELAQTTSGAKPFGPSHPSSSGPTNMPLYLNPASGPRMPVHSTLDANAPLFGYKGTSDAKKAGQVPHNGGFRESGAVESQTVASELTRFLLKKDLLLSRLSRFNDRPESYAVWKASFQSIMGELSVTPFEEMDLLVKWLGPESSKHALSIRTSNASHPDRGLRRIWERMDERYGCPEMVESALLQKLSNFPKLTKDYKKLYELADILAEVEAAKENENYRTMLAYFDSSSGVMPIVSKLPHQLQEKWTTRAVNYKRQNGVTFPPFSVFAEFVREMSKIKNDPGLNYDNPCGWLMKEKPPTKSPGSSTLVSTRKTELLPGSGIEMDKVCPLHKTGHTLNKCKGFRNKSLEDRRKFLKEKHICFKCCESDQHVRRACKAEVKCGDCGSSSHPSALHISSAAESKSQQSPPAASYGGESNPTVVASKCTQICNQTFGGKSCAKTLLVTVFPNGHPEEGKQMYAMVDDQSNRSLANSTFFSLFNIKDGEMEYSISSCSGNVTTSGRRASGFTIQSLDGNIQLSLPTLIECSNLPNVREEIPTPEVARYHPHLQDIVDHIPPINPEFDIILLIGRDLIEAHHVQDQRIGPRGSPYAQKLSLGWVIIGETCLGKRHRADSVSVKKTYVLRSGRPSIFEPCNNEFVVREKGPSADRIGMSVFDRTKDDDKLGLSVEDRNFLVLMDKEFYKGPS